MDAATSSPARRRAALAAAAVAALAAFAGGIACASPEVDPDLMRSIDDSAKNLDSDIGLKDARAAAAEARSLAEAFARVQQHYEQRGDAADAVRYAQRVQDLASRTLQAVEAGDYDAAGDAVGDLRRSCKSCHQAYRKE